MNILSVGEANSYFGPAKFITSYRQVTDDTDLIIVWGGEDINPGMYQEKNVAARGVNRDRDEMEYYIIDYARKHKIPILGICRGAQMLCVMSGGKLWQHVDNHAGPDHYIELKDGERVLSNSAHHQMMRPGDDAEIVAVTDRPRSPRKINGDGLVISAEPEVEIAYFPKYNALGIQGHPEWLEQTSALTLLTKRLVKEYLNVTL